MKVAWLVDGVTGDWTAGPKSAAASNRYRAIIPATELRRQGHAVELFSMSDREWSGRVQEFGIDVVVVSKQFGWQDRPRYERVAEHRMIGLRALAAAGVPVVVDFCDDHFGDGFLGPHWRTLATEADLCVAGSAELQDTVRRHTAAPVETIGDPIASPRFEPRVFKPRSMLQGGIERLLGNATAAHRIRLVWYGNPSNADALFGWADRLVSVAADQPWWLSVVTNEAPSLAQRIDRFNASHGGKCVMELVPWAESTQWQTVEASDVVLIPADLSSPGKRAKTANRLTDALHAGRAVIASALPSYLPFTDSAVLTDDPVGALRQYLAEPASALARIRKGQAAATEHASPATIAAKWLAAVEQARHERRARAERPRAAPPAAPAPVQAPVRLNLGCGDKILSGYVNVDVVASRAGKSPDVICDLHQLTPFEDNHADEILAVHVIEHFWRWEVEDILREWIRVLKPGGRMVLECPNLAAACEAFLANPDAASRPDAAGQRTMWVFYGDPQWQDPLMVHRWGYTPSSLAKLMEQCGLVNARQEPAEYKLREPRDMRVVAEKPL
jgi:SAM-dependent methyltransferase